MGKVNKYMSIDDMVRTIARSGGDESVSKYVQIAENVRIAINQLNLHLIPRCRSYILAIGSNLTIELPSEVIKVVKVGVVLPDGKVRVFGRDDSLVNKDLARNDTQANTIHCTCNTSKKEEVQTVEAASVTAISEAYGQYTCPACTFHNVCIDGSTNFYGYRAPQFRNGEYAYDYQYNRIVFGSGYDIKEGVECVIECVVTTEDNDYQIIPAETLPIIRQRVLQYMNETNGNHYGAQHHSMEFRREFRQLKRFYQQYTIQDIVSALRGEYHRTVK